MPTFAAAARRVWPFSSNSTICSTSSGTSLLGRPVLFFAAAFFGASTFEGGETGAGGAGGAGSSPRSAARLQSRQYALRPSASARFGPNFAGSLKT